MRKNFDDLPSIVQITASTHIAMLQTALPGRLEAYHVVGSAALGDFVLGKSDLDFIAVTKGALPPWELEKLKDIHSGMKNRKLFAGLDGYYVQASGFGGDGDALLACPRFNEGRFLGLRPFSLNSPDAWVLKQYGVSALGNSPEELPFEVHWESALAGMKRNLNSYWRKWAADSRRPCTIKALGMVARPAATEWAVLGITRLYYSFLEWDVASKTGAGEYALKALPERWHKIVREALRVRSGGAKLYESAIRRRNDALEYLDFMLDECNRINL